MGGGAPGSKCCVQSWTSETAHQILVGRRCGLTPKLPISSGGSPRGSMMVSHHAQESSSTSVFSRAFRSIYLSSESGGLQRQEGSAGHLWGI